MENITFIDDDSLFELKYENKRYFFPYSLEADKIYENKEFSLYFFYKNNYSENNIFQVYLQNKCNIETRLGYLFPLSAINSDSHNFSQDEYFLRYSYITFKYLIKEIRDRNLITENHSEEINIEEIFEENLFLFIHSKETIKKTHLTKFRLNDFLASFFINGFVPYNFEKNKIHKTDLCDLHTNAKMKIYHMSDQLKEDSFVINVLNTIFPYQNDYIIDFFYCYQIFELLMDKVFKKEIFPMINTFKGNLTDSRKIIDVIHDIREITSEKSRISKIETDYLSTKLQFKELLKDECIKILKNYNKEFKGNDLKDFFYAVRNLIFHQYRIINSSEELKSLTEQLNYLTCELIINFECLYVEDDYSI